MAPVTLAVTRELQIAPFPFLIAEVLASNIGGTATLVGDPPNIMIGSQAGLSFNSFLFHLAPIVVVVQAVQALMLHLIWGRATHATVENRLRVMTLDARAAIVDLPLLLQSMAVLAVVIVALVFEDRLQLEPATIAMGGAAVLMLLDNWEHRGAKQTVNVTRTLTEVEWITIFFFVGLFIVVHAVEVSGLLQLLAGKLVAVTGNNLALGGVIILWLSAFLAALIDNIPFVAVMIPVIKAMAPAFGGPAHIAPLWWCLSLGACLGGNGTLIGATANLTVAGIAERNGIAFGFVRYTLYALPMMIVSILICQLYVWLRYFYASRGANSEFLCHTSRTRRRAGLRPHDREPFPPCLPRTKRGTHPLTTPLMIRALGCKEALPWRVGVEANSRSGRRPCLPAC